MKHCFTYHCDPVRIVFGAGAIAALRAEADFHNMSRLMVLCSKSRAEFARRVTASIADRCVGICDASAPNMPREAFERIVAELKRLNADGFIVVGGGSPIGLAKAAAAATKIPYIAAVTTYSGSEMAARWYVGVAENRVSGIDRACLPATAIYDPELTLDLPVRASAASGMNAMAHAVESLYGIDTNPVVQTMAEEAVRRLGSSLPRLIENPRDLAARTDALYGAWLAANFRAEIGLEHAIAQRVRQWFNLDHAHTHAVATPYAIGFNSAAAPDAMERIRRALGVPDAARGLYDLNVRLGLPTGLKGLGMREEDIAKAVEVVSAVTITHPRPVAKPTSPRSSARPISASRRDSDKFDWLQPLQPARIAAFDNELKHDDRHRGIRDEMGRPRHPAAGRSGIGDRTRPLYRRSAGCALGALRPQPDRVGPHRRHQRAQRCADRSRRRPRRRAPDPADAAQIQLSADRAAPPRQGRGALRRRADRRRHCGVERRGGGPCRARRRRDRRIARGGGCARCAAARCAARPCEQCDECRGRGPPRDARILPPRWRRRTESCAWPCARAGRTPLRSKRALRTRPSTPRRAAPR